MKWENKLTSSLQDLARVTWLVVGLLLTALLGGCGQGVGTSDQSQDPVIQDLPVIYIKRDLMAADDGGLPTDLRRPLQVFPGAELYFKSQASPSAEPLNISDSLFPAEEFADEDGNVFYDLKHLSVSYDGQKLLFAAHAPEDEEFPERSWNIYEYSLETRETRRLIKSDIIADEGDDLFPVYLPDGRILFSSTRQKQSKAILLDEGKPQYTGLDEDRRDEALTLHVMSDEGEAIEQITFNQSNDTHPVVLSDGRIAFVRWDNAGANNEMNLYTVLEDGTSLQLLYGSNSHETGTDDSRVQYDSLQTTEDDHLVAVIRDFTHDQAGGDIVKIDYTNYVDINRETSGDSTQNLGQLSLSNGQAITTEALSLSGRYHSINPLWDGSGRFLVSWSPCRLIETTEETDEENTSAEAPTPQPCTEANLANETLAQAEPLYGLWLLDINENSQLPVHLPEENSAFQQAVIMQSRPLPITVIDSVVDDELKENGLGVVNIRSVYDMDGVDITPGGITAMADPLVTAADNRPAQFIRIEKPVSIPDDEVLDFERSAFGFSGNQLMREIIGYVPVEPDGSAQFTVPSDVAFSLSVTDSLGRRITNRHQNWLQLRPGEVYACNGCHERNAEVSHGRLDAQPDSVHAGAETTGLPFPNTRPELFANMGETMAEVYARINAPRTPSVNLSYSDEWTDDTIRPLFEAYSRDYQSLETLPPTNNTCLTEWQVICRIVINYEDHIQPIWEQERPILDADGITELENRRCTGCHATTDADGIAKVPDGQLQLDASPSTDEPDHFTSYRELLRTDFEQELVDGILVDREELVFDGEGNPVFLEDDEGNLIVDAEGNPVQATQRFPVPAVLSTGGAFASDGFFSRFLAGGAHEGFLSEAELRLLAEWLDIGGQYFNNPFDSVED